jgi:hypothetical protein
MPLSIEDWQSVAIKTATSSFPSRLYYDASLDADGYSTIAVYPIPDNDNVDVVLYLAVTAAAMEANTEYTFPPAYESVLINNLAVKLKKFYPTAPLDAQVVRDAMNSKYLIKRANWKPQRVLTDAPWAAGTYNIYSDEYERHS